jgi:hypothetical protein
MGDNMRKVLLVLMGIILVLSASAKFYEPVQNREIEMGNYTVQITAPQAAGYSVIGNFESSNGAEIEFSIEGLDDRLKTHL